MVFMHGEMMEKKEKQVLSKKMEIYSIETLFNFFLQECRNIESAN